MIGVLFVTAILFGGLGLSVWALAHQRYLEGYRWFGTLCLFSTFALLWACVFLSITQK